MNIRTFSQRLMLLLPLTLLAACNNSQPLKHSPDYAPPAAKVIERPQPQNGSIYQAGQGGGLFEDMKAFRIGDILSVNLEETISAEKSATSAIDRTNQTTVTNPTILGTTPQFNAPGLIPLATNRANNLGTNLNSTTAFSGESEATQSNRLQGSIMVNVVDVMPNGYLKVQGERRMRLSDGDEYVRLAGIVRPLDVQPDNSVSSTKVANATIEYVGEGAQADATKMGWLARFFINAVWPF